MIICKRFYKVVVLEVGLLESNIVDERHFPTREKAVEFQHSVITENGLYAILFQM